jgi:hypothetical protein
MWVSKVISIFVWLGKNAPLQISIFFFEVIFFHCAMSFNGEDTKLKVNCKDKFKEYDEII